MAGLLVTSAGERRDSSLPTVSDDKIVWYKFKDDGLFDQSMENGIHLRLLRRENYSAFF